MTPVPQKNSDLSGQEVTRQAKEKLKNALKTNNVDPNTLIKLGNMAFASINEKADRYNQLFKKCLYRVSNQKRTL